MTKKLYDAIQSIRDEDVLEDRSEYGLDQLRKMYDLDESEGEDLYKWVQDTMDVGGLDIGKADPLVIREFFAEAEHGSWDGWPEGQRVVLDLMMLDLRRWIKYYPTKD